MAIDNDTRGWIMTLASAIACILGASIICVHVLIRLLPGKKTFNIQDSNAFLSSSLSLTFGVMLFSSLYSILPSAKKSLQNGGYSPKHASWILIVCFGIGVVGIQVISTLLHHFIPSHGVDCGHVHGHHEHEDGDEEEAVHEHHGRPPSESPSHSHHDGHSQTPHSHHRKPKRDSPRRQRSLPRQWSSKVSDLVSTNKAHCHAEPQCFGSSEPCGVEYVKSISARRGSRTPSPSSLARTLPNGSMCPPGLSSSSTIRTLTHVDERQPLLQHMREDAIMNPPKSAPPEPSASGFSGPSSRKSLPSPESVIEADCNDVGEMDDCDELEHDLHHHVPSNAFLSIGLQTSIAIALHKLPEGFITYATNHANPKLGFSVFMALFIHNIIEGYAMALPLYLAMNNRAKAMLWSSLLGGASQPLGAGIAALWFKLAGTGGKQPGDGVYGVMFAVTAGVMASVALQLFSASLLLTHNRNLCLAFAFVGMGMLGLCSALTA